LQWLVGCRHQKKQRLALEVDRDSNTYTDFKEVTTKRPQTRRRGTHVKEKVGLKEKSFCDREQKLQFVGLPQI